MLSSIHHYLMYSTSAVSSELNSLWRNGTCLKDFYDFRDIEIEEEWGWEGLQEVHYKDGWRVDGKKEGKEREDCVWESLVILKTELR